jgi:SAM-dependent methyltransferase
MTHRDPGLGDSSLGPVEQPIDNEWFTHAFDDVYEITYSHRTIGAAQPEADFAAHALDLTPTDTVLDLCCGIGRHLVRLVHFTPHCYGLDFSVALLARAVSVLGPGARLVRADMRAIPFGPVFDAVVNFFTSFGYFLERSDNERAARELARVLRPGGRFFVDFVNAEHTRNTLTPFSARISGGHEIRETRWIDEAAGRINKKTLVTRDGAVVRELTESVQLYNLAEFTALFETAGLRVDSVYGDYQGASFQPTSPRMIVVGRKV